VKGFVSISIPYFQRDPNTSFLQTYRKTHGDGFFICQFQEPGRAEKSFARYDNLTVIKKFMRINKTDMLIASPGMEIIDCMETPFVLPPWITEEELQVYAQKFQQTGYSTALNYYRAIELNWIYLAPWQGAKITVATKLIMGDRDLGYESTRNYINGDDFKRLVPNLEVAIMDGSHFIHQEKAQEVSHEIFSFFKKFSVD
jgi:pimeloyl-ACP methyl ester carboxylesterase